jgi:UV DNA damage endonuclease
MIRWGLCCQFVDAPIKFRTATHRYVSGLSESDRRGYLTAIALANAEALIAAVEQCHRLGIGAFRITSDILPLITHPITGYALTDDIRNAFRAAGAIAKARGVRLSFHPDQFVVLNSIRPEVVDSAIRELESQAKIADLIAADIITLHGGGAVGGKEPALDRLWQGIDRLSDRARNLLALENDDRVFSVADLVPICGVTGVPLVYDVHHHRCNPDGLTVEEATELALDTWIGREPYFHISSSRDHTGDPRPHSDYILTRDIPVEWRGLTVTVDVEAKAKERAVLRLLPSRAAIA